MLASIVLRATERINLETIRGRAYLPKPVWSGFTIPEILDWELGPARNLYPIELEPANISGIRKR